MIRCPLFIPIKDLIFCSPMEEGGLGLLILPK
jgi:hypothetical protein